MNKRGSDKRKRKNADLSDKMEAVLERWSRSSGPVRRPIPPRKWSITEREAILDYLHGTTPPDQVKACCYYEYARNSELFRGALGQYNPSDQTSLYKVFHNFSLFRNDWRRSEILICPGFPEVPWRELSKQQRQNIQLHFAKGAEPVITDSFILDSLGTFERFKQKAESDRRDLREHPGAPPGSYPAIIGENAIKRVVITLDYREGRDALKDAVSDWLKGPANEGLFKKYYKKPIHKQNLDSPDRYNELLKFLAAWRLHDELGLTEAKKWTKTQRRKADEPPYHSLPFFRQKLRKTPQGKHYVGPVFKDGRQWQAAIAKAKSFIRTEIERAGAV